MWRALTVTTVALFLQQARSIPREGYRGTSSSLSLVCPGPATPFSLPCAGVGHCDRKTGTCSCPRGYSGVACETNVFQFCPGFCSDNGEYCIVNTTAVTAKSALRHHDDAEGPDDFSRTFVFQPAVYPGTCVCKDGFDGPDCQRTSQCARRAFCSGHGSCIDGACECHLGWSGFACDHEIDCSESSHCSGHGVCHRPWTNTSSSPVGMQAHIVDSAAVCHCDSPFSSAACNEAPKEVPCPWGCSGRGVCDAATSRCTCFPGYTGPACASIANMCGFCGNGYCRPVEGKDALLWKCKCLDGFQGDSCDQLSEPPDLPCKVNAYCSGHGICDPHTDTCVCQQPFTGAACDRLGSSSGCPNGCSGRGKCDTSSLTVGPLCRCLTGWSGRDCSQPACLVGVNGAMCSGKGLCDRVVVSVGISNLTQYQCSCDAGFDGDDCGLQLRPCPHCSPDHGTCLDGECVCSMGWGGADCTADLTPAQVGSLGPSDQSCCPRSCSDHGSCDMLTCECECVEDWGGADCSYYTGGDDMAG